jgi:integrase
MRFEEYAQEWKGGQRHLTASSVRHLESLFEHHIFPAIGSREMMSFGHKVVDGFIRTMERAQTGLATQSSAFDKVRAILLDAQRLGLYAENPLEGVKGPQYDPARAVIPSLEQLRGHRTAGDAWMLLVDLMSGCGLRNGEAAAVNLSKLVADDVYRVSEQVVQTTGKYGPLKHRKAGEYRDVPLPARVRETIYWYAEKHGTVDGYLLRQADRPEKPYPHWGLSNQWKRLKEAGAVDIPERMVIYGYRHFFASNCLTNGLAITDVAEWMGHRSIDVTFKIYRHLMPGSIGKAAQVLDMALAA